MRDGTLRLRQICLVAPALRPAEESIAAVLGVAVCFRDPGVGRYGLENALFPLGTGVLEVVAPVREGTAAGRFLDRSGGRGGYMVILDCDDPERRRAHAEALGVRAAHVYRHEDNYLGVQLHPRDCRAAMIEFNHTRGGEALTGPYHPAGPDWPRVAREGPSTPRLLAVEMESPDPAGLAAHWGRIMDVPVAADAAEEGAPSIALPGGTILFRRAGEAGEIERLAGLRIGLPDPARALAAAEARGLVRPDGGLWLSGVRVALAGG